MDAKGVAELISAVASLAWPLLAVALLLKTLPMIQSLFQREKVRIKIGDLELSAEQVTEALTSQIKDLQAKLVQIETRLTNDVGDGVEQQFTRPLSQHIQRILWVDDVPTNNAISIDKLRGDGYDVVLALSTRDGVEQVTSTPGFDLIISDMARNENGRHVPNAGLVLSHEVRQRGSSIPIIIFSSSASVERYERDAREAGVTAMTSSVVDLYVYIQRFLSASGKRA